MPGHDVHPPARRSPTVSSAGIPGASSDRVPSVPSSPSDLLTPLDTTTTVDTPERVRFVHDLAGPGRRGLAWCLDACLRLLILISTVVALSAFPVFEDVGLAGVFLVLFALEWGYGALFETALSGRTPGKLLVGLRVVREDGAPIRPADAVLRNLLRAADFLPALFAIGLSTMLFDARMRRLGDLAAGTMVVVERRRSLRMPGEGASTASVPLAPSLPRRVDLSRDERLLLDEFVRRRPKYTPQRNEELAGLFGPALSERTGVRGDTWEEVLLTVHALHRRQT